MTIFTRKQQPIQIDTADALRCQGVAWHIDSDGYAKHTVTKSTAALFNQPAGSVVKMHRWVMGATDPRVQVDHVNRDKTDNRRCNLRLCTAAQNNANKVSSRGKSKYKGVSYRPESRKHWRAICMIHGERRCLGSYETEEEAARIYNEAAREMQGEFAVLNDVPEAASSCA